MLQGKDHGPDQQGMGPGRLLGGRAHGSVASTGATAAEAPAKLLIVGPDITLAGEITACDRLVVEGSVQVTLNRTRAIEIAPSGRFTNGRAEVEEADIAGLYEGELTVRGRLLIRATGKVSGSVRYGELELERGGRLTGSVAVLEAGPMAEIEPPPAAAILGGDGQEPRQLSA